MNSLYGGLGYIFTDRSNQNLKITFLIGSVLRKINSHISCPLALSDLKVHHVSVSTGKCQSYLSLLVEDKEWKIVVAGEDDGVAWHTTETVTECRGHLDTIWWFVSKYFDLIIVNIF